MSRTAHTTRQRLGRLAVVGASTVALLGATSASAAVAHDEPSTNAPKAASGQGSVAKASRCGKGQVRSCRRRPTAHTSIVNGYVPHPTQWPWVAFVDLPGTSYCGGTLIQPRVVLTAAHCVRTPRGRVRARGVRVLLGRRVLSNPYSGELIRVRKIVVHPRYRRGYDIALLRLSRRASEMPALLGRPGDWGSSATAMGWGHTSEGGTHSDALLAVDLPLFSDRQCRGYYGRRYLGSLMLCAGANGGDTCQGDSGGGLMVQGGPRGWKLIGVTSFGDGCGRWGVPGVYAWAAGGKLRSWIKRHA